MQHRNKTTDGQNKIKAGQTKWQDDVQKHATEQWLTFAMDRKKWNDWEKVCIQQ